MSPDDLHADPLAHERDLLRYRVLTPLAIISVRTELLQRITQQTPGLTDLERAALLNGLAAILDSARDLGRALELVISEDAQPATPLPEESR